MTSKANEYANFKSLRSYVISIFDWAEELEYIEANKVAKILRRIRPLKDSTCRVKERGRFISNS